MLETMLSEVVKNFGLRMSKEELVSKVELLICKDYDVCVLNEKYLIVNGEKYQFIKTKNGWVAKQW